MNIECDIFCDGYYEGRYRLVTKEKVWAKGGGTNFREYYWICVYGNQGEGPSLSISKDRWSDSDIFRVKRSPACRFGAVIEFEPQDLERLGTI